MPKGSLEIEVNAEELQQTVIRNGFCIGCGACAVTAGSPFTIKHDRYGRLQAKLEGNDQSQVPFDEICPFGAKAPDEDTVADIFLGESPQRHAAVGRFRTCHIGHVKDTLTRGRASSGGIGRWLAAEMLRQDLVDAVVHVTPDTSAQSPLHLFRFSVTQQPEELEQSARSAYYPVSLDRVLDHIRQRPGRYVITGVPCFIKAMRLLSLHDPIIRERIVFTIGIICGHLKSSAFAEAFGWQLGVPPEDLAGIEFRGKLASAPANHKGVSAKSRSESTWTAMHSSKTLLGGDWGLGLFKYKACDYCDDVTAETADVAIGDAWLPEFVNDSQGTSVIICRNRAIESLLKKGQDNGALNLLDSTPEQIARSQAGGLRHRREGLAYRLARDEALGRWHPPKRVAPSDTRLTGRRKKIYELRSALAEYSHEAFLQAKEVGDFSVFIRMMQPLINRYERAQVPWHKLLRKRAKAFLKKNAGTSES
ncbi:MAG TPA: Coenzyme F420 hydrogenase/dehydrogenase, beta subunit C-terminal domain [Gammaproteobacteria bacterium]|nr:Coenzyme F420 hydrogenase/dehydrogenase, beta subunit C-terminal domain [Gammaproteobacteria bacterium]